MVKLLNCGPKQFVEEIRGKDLYFFGAGNVLGNCMDLYCQETKLRGIIDNNEKLWGTKKSFLGCEVPLISAKTFVERIRNVPLDRVVLLITSMFYGAEIIEQLDAIPELDGLPCYLHAVIRNTKEVAPEYEFTVGEQIIPKKIHYIWVGGKPIPEQFQKCIDSWRIHNPAYEIIRWDESNYDFSKIDYMREAYEKEAWGFVPDYARLDILYQYGGIYLDTDVEAVSSFDILLNDDVFFGLASGDRINVGVGFGAGAEHPLIKELRDVYLNKHFVDETGKRNRIPCYYYQHPILQKHGFQVVNEYQKKDGVVVYPAEVLSPLGTGGLGNFFSEKTVAIHHGSGSWLSGKETAGIQRLKKLVGVRLGVEV